MNIGLDIGGANLKASHSDGPCLLQPFALWRDPQRLPAELGELLRKLPPARLLAVTMTGELCDCFANKCEGVTAILDAVEAVAEGRALQVWSVNGFLDSCAARTQYLEVASANWHALAACVAREVSVPGLLIDVGSTTADIIPIAADRVLARGHTDPERLRTGELVYTGVRRTPVCAVLGPGVAAELFATTLDAHLLLGHIAETHDDCNTADGRPATRKAAHARMARMLCADPELFSREEAAELARRVAEVQVRCLAEAMERVAAATAQTPQMIVLCGSGEFLGRMALEHTSMRACNVMSLTEHWGEERSAAACAHALVRLAGDSHILQTYGR